MTAFRWMHIVRLILLAVPVLSASPAPFAGGSEICFAEPAEARRLIRTDDEFMRALSPFDRAFRMNSDSAVTAEAFRNYLAEQVLPWNGAERERVRDALSVLDDSLRAYKCPFPKKIFLVKTTGNDEGDAPYTRQNAVFIPRNILENETIPFERLLIHELFHILSRFNPSLQDSLYRCIGFERCNPIEMPEALLDRKMTNPDAPVNDHYITVEYQGTPVPMVPVLMAGPGFRPGKNQNIFDFLDLKFLAVRRTGGEWRPQIIDGNPRMIEVIDILPLFEKIGSNTSYIIHPDEILADNFMMMVLPRQNAPSPEIIDCMKNILQR